MLFLKPSLNPQTLQEGVFETPAMSRGLSIRVFDTLLDRHTLQQSAIRALAPPSAARQTSAPGSAGLEEDELPAFFKVAHLNVLDFSSIFRFLARLLIHRLGLIY